MQCFPPGNYCRGGLPDRLGHGRSTATARLRRFFTLTRALCGLTLVLQAGTPARAATIDVTTTNDVIAPDGLVSLREAVIWANTNQGLDTIQLPAGIYTLTILGDEDDAVAGDLDFRDCTAVTGASARTTIIDGNGIDRVMFLDQNTEVWLWDLSVAGGLAYGDGGGIYNQSTARLVRCQIYGNGAYNAGGGIEQYSGAMYLDQCSVYLNAAGSYGGGGIDIHAGLLSATNSTIARNASRAGAGIFRDGGVVHLFSCSIVSNEAEQVAGGIWNGVQSMSHTVVSTNWAPAAPDVSGSAGSLGFNLIGNSDGVWDVMATDILQTNAMLGGLRFRGGTTPTHGLLRGSPAINRGDPAYPTQVVAQDQRGDGFPRRRGVRVDIGAFEFTDPDEDADGIPDEWEMAFGLDPYDPAGLGDDDDGDTFTTWQEYVADTDPTNGASFHRLDGVAVSGTLCAVQFPSSTGRVYALELATNLASGTWSPVLGPVPGRMAQTVFTDSNCPPAGAYRVGVNLPP